MLTPHFLRVIPLCLAAFLTLSCASKNTAPATEIKSLAKIPAPPTQPTPPITPEKTLAEKIAQALPEIGTVESTSYLSDPQSGQKYTVISYVTPADIQCQTASSEAGDWISFLRIAILLETPSEFRVVAKSQRFERYGPQDDVRYKIRNDALHLIHTNASSNTANRSEVWKFKFKLGVLQLVGYDVLDTDQELNDEQGELFSEIGKSVNFATMQVIDWRKLGATEESWDDSKTWYAPFRVKSPIKYKEFTRLLPNQAPINFTDFNFTSWSQWNDAHICGFVDEQFKYWSCAKPHNNKTRAGSWSCGPPYQPEH